MKNFYLPKITLYLLAISFATFLTCVKKVKDNNNTLTALVLTISDSESFAAVLDAQNKTGTISVPYGTDISKLKVKSLAFSPTATSSVTVGNAIFTPPPPQDNSFKLTITAQSGDTAVYTFTITIVEPDKNNTLTALSLTLDGSNSFATIIDTQSKTGRVNLPYGTDINKLKVKSIVFPTTAKCSIKTGDTLSLEKDSTFKATITAQSGDKAIYSFTLIISPPDKSNTLTSLSLSLDGSNSFATTIDTQSKTGRVNLPYATDIKKLKVKNIVFPTTATCTIKIGDTLSLEKDSTFKATITAQSGDTALYTITVIVSNDNSNGLTVLSLSLGGSDSFVATVDTQAKTGAITVPFGTDLKKLKVKNIVFPATAKCSIKIGDTLPLTTGNTFNITITAETGDKAVYTITTTIDKNTAKDFLSFRFLKSVDNALTQDTSFTISGTNISGTINYLESNVLKPTFTVSSGAKVSVNGVEQVSGTSEQDFTSPVIYTVTPEKAGETPKTYRVAANFYYDKLTVSASGELNKSGGCFAGKLVLADSMNGYTVKSIANDAFKDCDSLTGSLNIPNTVTSIGSNAFRECKSFNGTLTLPNSITSIGSHAFQLCGGFRGSLTLPNSITSIGSYAFMSCYNFTGDLIIPNKLKILERNTFASCRSFTGSLTLPPSITKIGQECFYDCIGFTGTLTLPPSITRLDYSVFKNDSGFTGSLTIPPFVIDILPSAFIDCSGFTGTLSIPASVTFIALHAFKYCTGFTKLCNKSTATPGREAFQGVVAKDPTCSK